MGAGFPTRPSRTSLGPTYENTRTVRTPKQDIGAPVFNLNFWQLAGLGQVVPRAAVVFTVDGAPVVTAVPYQGLAWDPNSALAALTVVRIGVGDYDIPFAATYPDETGDQQALALIAGGGFVMGSTYRKVQVAFPAPPLAKVLIFDAAGAPADPPPGNTIAFFW